MRSIAVFLALLAVAGPSAAKADDNETIDVGGVQRTYVLHVPTHVTSPASLILAFHGHFGTGKGQARLSGLDALSDQYGFVVAYPDGLNRGWNDGRPGGRNTADDLGFTRALIADLSARYHIDPKRVFATGMSNGATFTQYLACNESASIAAIAPVSGSMPQSDVGGCRPKRPMPVLEIAGTADPIMPFGGGPITLLGMGTTGTVLSFDETLAFWATASACAAHPVATALAPIAPPDDTSVTRYAYEGCARGSNVVGYAISGGGHTWPGGPQYLSRHLVGPSSDQMDASLAIVKFFLAHPMR